MVKEGVPFLRSGNIQEGKIIDKNLRFISSEKHQILKKGHIKTGDILFTNRGEIGKIGIVDERFDNANLNSQVAWIRVNSQLYNRYLYYYLSTPSIKLFFEKNKTGTALQQITIKQLKSLLIKFPNFSEQQRIVAKLDIAFVKINKLIYTNEQKLLKVNLFNQALLKNEFNINSEKITLGKLIEYDKKNGQGSNLPYIGMENISSETMKIVGEINVPQKTSSTFKFNNSHVLFGRLRPYLKKVLIPDFEGQCSTEIFCIKISEKIDKNFLAYWLLSPSILYKINNSSTGTRMPRANMNELLNYQFPVLSISKQQQIVKKINTVFNTTDDIKNITVKKITNYQALKLSILSEEIQNQAA